MKLYVTYTSPFARLARVVVIEKGLQHRVEVIEAKTRTAGSPYYAINPSGRVPYLVTDDGTAFEDSHIISAYLDNLDGKPHLRPAQDPAWEYARLEASARSMTDGISVWGREMRRRENERSPTVLAHEVARAARMADLFETQVEHPLMKGPLNVAQLLLATGLDYGANSGFKGLAEGRPRLTAWHRRMQELPSMIATRAP
jgi:glutathione S-transferase